MTLSMCYLTLGRKGLPAHHYSPLEQSLCENDPDEITTKFLLQKKPKDICTGSNKGGGGGVHVERGDDIGNYEEIMRKI